MSSQETSPGIPTGKEDFMSISKERQKVDSALLTLSSAIIALIDTQTNIVKPEWQIPVAIGAILVAGLSGKKFVSLLRPNKDGKV